MWIGKGEEKREWAHTSLMTSYLPLVDKVTDEADDNVDLTSFSPALLKGWLALSHKMIIKLLMFLIFVTWLSLH